MLLLFSKNGYDTQTFTKGVTPALCVRDDDTLKRRKRFCFRRFKNNVHVRVNRSVILFLCEKCSIFRSAGDYATTTYVHGYSLLMRNLDPCVIEGGVYAIRKVRVKNFTT